MNTVESRVKDVVARCLSRPVEEIKNEHSFGDDLGADSLDAVELVMAFEDEFAVEIPDTEARGLLSVQKTIDFIEKKLNESQSVAAE